MAKCVRCGKSGLTLKLDALGYCPDCQAVIKQENENRIAAMQNELDKLRDFYIEYSVIPVAKKEQERILAEANATANQLIAEANAEAAAIREAAREEEERIHQELNALRASVDLEINAQKAKADEKLARIKSDSAATIAATEAQIAALFASAAKDFVFTARSTIAGAYSSEKKTQGNTSLTAEPFAALTPAAFKRAAKGGYIVFDLETTGLSAANDRIIEIGAIKYSEDHAELERFSTLINPGIPIPASATAINNITDQMVAAAPSLADVLPNFLTFVGALPVIAHNAGFDIAFLRYAVAAQHLDAHIQYADSLAMARKAYSLPHYKLGDLAKHLGIMQVEAHRSIGDCETLGRVVQDMLK